MTAFFITPYKPTEWQTATSDLKIDPIVYKRQLLERWPDAKFIETSESFQLEWGLYTRSEEGTLIPHGTGGLHSNLQITSHDTPYEEFFFWHRAVVPSDYRLFLSNASSWDSLELTSDTTIEDIERFCGGYPT